MRGRLALAVMSALALVGAVWAGPVEDAQALLAEKKFGEVDKALGKLLEQKVPDVKVLQVSLDAAVASGRIITANQRISALLKATNNSDPALVLQGAALAEAVGDSRLALGRYQLYVKMSKEKSDSLELALRYVLQRVPSADEYRRYVSFFGATPAAWPLAEGVIRRLCENRDREGILLFASGMLKDYPLPSRATQVSQLLWNAAEAGQLGREVRERYLAAAQLLVRYRQTSYSWTAQFYEKITTWDSATPEMKAELLLQLQKSAGEPLPQSLLSRISVMRAVADSGKRLELGKSFLALEPLFKPDPVAYSEYVQVLLTQPQVFAQPGKELLKPADITARLDAILPLFQDQPETQVRLIQNLVSVFFPENPQRIAFLSKHLPVLSPEQAAWLLDASDLANLNVVLAEASKGRDANWLARCQGLLLPTYDRLKKAPELLAAAKLYLESTPGNFNRELILPSLIRNKLNTPAEKLALLKDIATRGGCGVAMTNLFLDMEKDVKTWGKDPEFIKTKKEVLALKVGSDPIMSAQVAIYSLPSNSAAAAFKISQKVLADFKGDFPSENALHSGLLESICQRQIQLVGSSSLDIARVVQLWAPRLGVTNPLWNELTRRLLETNNRAVLGKLIEVYAEKNGSGKGSAAVWANLAGATNPSSEKADILAKYYDRVPPLAIWEYLRRQNQLDPVQLLAGAAKLVAMPEFPFGRSSLPVEMTVHLLPRVSAKAQPSPALVQGLWTSYLVQAQKSGEYVPGVEASVFGLFSRSGLEKDAAAFYVTYAEELKKRSLPQQIDSLSALVTVMARESDGKPLEAGKCGYLLLKTLKPAVEQIPLQEWGSVSLTQNVVMNAYWFATHWPEGEVLAEATTLCRRLALLMEGGMPYEIGSGAASVAMLAAQAEQAAGDLAQLPATSGLLARSLGESGTTINPIYISSYVTALCAKLTAVPEVCYSLLDQVQKRYKVSEQQEKQLLTMKGELARSIPAVAEDPDAPDYDLREAARALASGDEERAWLLTQPKLPYLQKVWNEQDPLYVAWSIDQMRKNKQLLPARDFCFTLLLKEQELDADVAAQVLLTKGDIFRDMGNGPAARVEYEGLKNNPRYRDTPAGSKARYRLLDLMIAVSDYAQADDILNMLVSSDDVATQAEAFFYKAKIAYAQEQWEEANEDVKEVFRRVTQHTEAGLLQGELILKRPGGLSKTEVEVGTPEAAVALMPGQPLTMKVKDRNLAIARQNASIPVIVTTIPSGDEEKVNLVAQAGDANTFVAQLPTALGATVKGDRVLQVRGGDTVSYVIDPVFQKAQSVDFPPHKLALRYDATLVASSGEILSPEEMEKREQERRAAQSSGETSARFTGRDVSTIRPGSPIYVQITDLTADVSDKPDTLVFSMKTSTGEAVDGLVATETGAHTGIFQAAVPTMVPLPRATASDSEVGISPSILIKPGNTKVWASLKDGAKPKWIEVDTMSSYAMKTVELKMPKRNTVRTISLSGRLADDFVEYAAFPARLNNAGLSAEYFNGTGFEGEPVLVQVDRKVVVRDPLPSSQLTPDDFSVRWSGTLTPEVDGRYAFYVDCAGPFSIKINDREVLRSGREGRQRLQASTNLKAGEPVSVLITYSQRRQQPFFQLKWQAPKQAAETIPTAFLQPKPGVGTQDGGVLALSITSDLGKDPSAERLRAAFKLGGTGRAQSAKPVYDRVQTPMAGREGWQINRVTGAFYTDEGGEHEFRFLQKPEAARNQTAYLFIDGKQVLGGVAGAEALTQTAKVDLKRGGHLFELLVQDDGAASQVIVGQRKSSSGEFSALPEDWFSARTHPQLAELLQPAKITATETGFLATFREPQQLRAVRWVFEDFSGDMIEAQNVIVTDENGEVVVPAAAPKSQDTGGSGKTGDGKEVAGKSVPLATDKPVEVAPGDKVAIDYEVPNAWRKDLKKVTAEMNTSFYNGSVVIANEVIEDDPSNANRRIITYEPAKRFRVGDNLAITIKESDEDLTAKRDSIPVKIRTSSGETLSLQALESSLGHGDPRNNHTGFFLAVLKTGEKTTKDTIGIKPGDLVIVSYLDKENTTPGIPFERIAMVAEAGNKKAELRIFSTSTVLVEDKSLEARAKLDRLRLRGLKIDDLKIYKSEILLRLPEEGEMKAVAKDNAKSTPNVDVSSPLLIEVRCPSSALNSGSELQGEVVADSELKAAEAAKREPQWTPVPLRIVPLPTLVSSKGYTLVSTKLTGIPLKSEDMLADGVFSGIVRMQIGNPGDVADNRVTVPISEFQTKELTANDDRYQIPAIIVSGSDTVHVRVKYAPNEEPVVGDARLLSDARVELMDNSYTVAASDIHLGENFYVRVVDPDRDTSVERDTIKIKIKAASGAERELTLSETLPHSGVFAAAVRPVFAGEAKKAGAGKSPEAAKGTGEAATSDAAEQTAPVGMSLPELPVRFGDKIDFIYQDEHTLDGKPRAVGTTGSIFFGFDGKMAAFSKRFADPEMAVKTRFLMAEALFEMAKGHRKLKQEELASEKVATGKRILEEAMRDYPDTTLVSQGEFLLANLDEELELYPQAIGRYAAVITRWPDSEYAARSLFKKALCEEKMENFDAASEDYVRVIYLHSDKPDLVADATLRLGSYYYGKAKAFGVASKIFSQFAARNSTHSMAPKALFLAGQCQYKLEDWRAAAEIFEQLVNNYTDNKILRAEAMYWLGDCYYLLADYKGAYQTFTKLTFDYPESKWAKIARGRLTEETLSNEEKAQKSM